MSGGGLSRRTFLGASGAGVALGLAPRSLARATPTDARRRLTADAVVVGGGLSGLIAARHLRSAGLSTVVLEARSQIAPSSFPPSLRADVTGLTDAHTRVRGLARELRVPIRRMVVDGQAVERVAGSTFVVPAALYSADSRVDAEVRAALSRLDWMARETDPSEPWRAANAAVRDRRTLQQWLDAKVPSVPARRRLATLFAAVWGADPSELSLLHALAVGAGSDGVSAVIEAATAPVMTVDGGEEALAARLAAPLGSAVHTDAIVRSIIQDASGVTVATDSVEVRARRGVVVAVPVVATAGIRFEPGLPRERALLSQRMPRGSSAAAAGAYPRAFWRSRDLSGRAVADDGPAGVAFAVAAGFRRTPTLVARFSGAQATEWESLPADRRRAEALDALRAWFGDPAGEPTAYAEVVSGGDEWPARGPASLAPSGVLSTWGPALRAPFGLVAWAGTETARAWAGFAEGSVESGERAAGELLAGLAPLAGSSARAAVGAVPGDGEG